MPSPALNATCPPPNELPDATNLTGVPLDVATYLVPAQEALYEPVQACCGPSPVGLADGCYFWCEQPAAAYPHLADWLDCLHAHAPNGTKVSIVGEHDVSGAPRLQTGAPATRGMVVLAVLVGSMCTWF